MKNQNPNVLESILSQAKTVAVVGLSPNRERESHDIALYLKERGYHIIPVNPNADEILGEKSYPNLRAISEAVDVVQIFRNLQAILNIVEDAIAAKVIWIQVGIIREAAALRSSLIRGSVSTSSWARCCLLPGSLQFNWSGRAFLRFRVSFSCGTLSTGRRRRPGEPFAFTECSEPR